MTPLSDPSVVGRQVELLYRNVRLGQIVSIINASFLVWIAHTQISHDSLAIWWSLTIVTASLRMALGARFNGQTQVEQQSAITFWRQRALMGASASGVLWAAGALLLMGSGNTILQLFTAFIMAGMVAGAVPVLAAHRQAFRSYAWPIVIAVVIGAMGKDALHIAFSTMSLLFLLIATRSADYFHDTLQNTFRLEHEKDMLLENLEHARQIAEQSNRAKTEFLANISHELRTPMNGIIGLGELLDLEELSQDQRNLLTPMLESSHALMHLINHLIELSALEAGQVKLSPSPFAVSELLPALVSNHRKAATAKGLAMLEEAPELPQVLIGDVDRLRQVFAHLIGNAIKFTEHGSIHISVKVAEVAAAVTKLEFSVTDTGPGIPPKILPQLRGLFVQADGSSMRRHGGIGIGLPISRKLIELLGGELRIESKVNVGSRFSFTLPFALAEAD